MALCRWGWGGSELYIYESVYGGITCCGCPNYRDLPGDKGPFSWSTTHVELEGDDAELPRETYDEMIEHVQGHIDAGHRVIADVIPQLIARRDHAEIVLTEEQRADREYADTDILDFMGMRDPELRAQMGVTAPYKPHPRKEPCECGSGQQKYLCFHEIEESNA